VRTGGDGVTHGDLLYLKEVVVYDDQIDCHAKHVFCSRLIILINTPVLIQDSRVPSDQSCPVIVLLFIYVDDVLNQAA